jgi:hypothetical protein
MLARRHVAALLAVIFACGGPVSGGGGPAPEPPPQACLIVADNPHRSSTADRKGLPPQLIGKGWFKCSAGPPQDITVYVQVQQKSGAGWNKVANNSQVFHRPAVGKRSDEVVAVALGCPSGTFRTAAKGTGHDQNGDYKESDWSYSATVVDPCKK